MLRIIANMVSTVLHPLLIPTLATILFFYVDKYAYGHIANKELYFLIIFINSFAFPMVCISLMKVLGFISSLKMEDKQERTLPFIATMIFYIWTFMIVKNKLNFPISYILFNLGALVSLCLAFVVNIFHKTSIHMAAMGGLLFAVTLQLFSTTAQWNYPFAIIVILSGLVASSRLYLKAHTSIQIYTGFLVGIIGQISALIIANFLW